MNLRVTSIIPTIQQDPATGAETVGGYQLTLQGVENPIPIPSNGQVPVVFTMQEMGIDFPVVFARIAINPTIAFPTRTSKCRNRDFPVARWGRAMMGGDGSRNDGAFRHAVICRRRFAARWREAGGCRWQRRCARKRRRQ